MASNAFVFTGLDELKAELRALPASLAGAASGILLDVANNAAFTVRAEYTKHRTSRSATGKKLVKHLADGVRVTTESAGTFGARVTVRSDSELAWLFDNGSQARHYFSVNGVQHDTGAMGSKTPPTHIFAGTMAKSRRKMYERLKTLIETYGLQVTGDAG